MGTQTITVDFGSPKFREADAEVIVKLMMACNDLTIANQSLGDWNAEKRRERISRRDGARMYFLRAQIAHLYEALKIIDEIKVSRTLLILVESCDLNARSAFQELLKYAAGGPERERFERIAGRVRSNLVFHYNEDGKLIGRAIGDRAERKEAQYSLITRGSTAHLWYFKAADAVVDSIVVRQIWQIPRPADLRAEADRVAVELQQVFVWFLDFAGSVIWKYCER